MQSIALHNKWKLLRPDVSLLDQVTRQEQLKLWMDSYIWDIIIEYRKETRRLK